MHAVSWVAGALAAAVMSTVATAVEPPPYRAVVFDWEIGDGAINDGSVLTLSRWPSTQAGGDEAATVDWVGVGAIGNDFRAGDGPDERDGCIWLGQITGTGAVDWCAFDINPLTIMPSGMNIEALHDINECGVAVGVASQEVSGLPTNRLVYLTEAADLNGDLVTDGTDLSLFMASWGTGCAGNRLYDLDGDGCIGGGDFALLIAGWGGHGPGEVVSVALECQDEDWLSPLKRYPYIVLAAGWLGFESMEELADTTALLTPSGGVGLCEVVDALADALRGAE